MRINERANKRAPGEGPEIAKACLMPIGNVRIPAPVSGKEVLPTPFTVDVVTQS